MPFSVLDKCYAEAHNIVPSILSVAPAMLVHGTLKLLFLIDFVVCISALQLVGVLHILDNKLLCAASEEAALWPFFIDHQARSLCRVFSLMIPSAWTCFFHWWSHNCYLPSLGPEIKRHLPQEACVDLRSQRITPPISVSWHALLFSL